MSTAEKGKGGGLFLRVQYNELQHVQSMQHMVGVHLGVGEGHPPLAEPSPSLEIIVHCKSLVMCMRECGAKGYFCYHILYAYVHMHAVRISNFELNHSCKLRAASNNAIGIF